MSEKINEELKEELKDEQIPVPQDAQQILEQRKKEVEDFLSNEDNQIHALILAKDFYNIMGEKWFTLEKAVKKTKLGDSMMTFQKLKLLEMFHYCTIKKGDPLDPKERGKVTFKLHLDKSHEIKAIDDTISQMVGEIEGLKIKRAILVAQLNPESVKEN